MKKVTLLVASVLCALGSYAQSSIGQLPTEIGKTTYQIVSPRGTLYYDKTVEESYLTSNCMTGRNQNDVISLDDERGQFLVIPAENNNAFYLYSVEAKKFVNHTGFRAGLTDEPTEIAMWAHGQTATGRQAYNQSQFSYADYPFTIADEYVEGVTVNDGKHLNSINICCWDSANPDYRWCDTSHYDDGNVFKVVEAGELDQDTYNEVREALGLGAEVVEPEVPEVTDPTAYTVGEPIVSGDQLKSGKYFVSVFCKNHEGLLIGNDWKNVSENVAEVGTSYEDFDLVWDLEFNNDGFFTLTNAKGQTISVQGERGVGKHNVKYTDEGDFAPALFSLNEKVVDIEGVSHFMVYQQEIMVGGASVAYLHCNCDNPGIGEGALRVSYWQGENPDLSATCDKIAFYPAVAAGETPVDPEPPVVVDPVEYGPVLLSTSDKVVSYKIHNLGADDGNYKGNNCYVKYVEEKAGNWNSLWHTDAADDADNFAFFAAEDGGVYIKDVTANKFVTWKQNAEGGINWGSHQLTACQVTLVDAMADAKSWFIVDDENTEGRYDIIPLEGANNGWSFMGGIDQDFVVLNLEKKTDRNIKWVFEQVEEETPVDPVDPVEPEELTWSPVEAGGIYAIVNIQPTGNNFYLDYLEGNLCSVDAANCNTLYEWPETAKFQAVELADGRFAFKNCGTGNYLAWKGNANNTNTTGVYNNQGYDPEINEHSSWTLNESVRYEGAYWFRAEQRNDIPGDGQNVTGTLILSNYGEWNAWLDGEYLPANGERFSNSFGFYLIEKGEAPEPPVDPEPEYNYAEEVAPVLAEANEALEGHDHVYDYHYSYGDALLTEASQFSSPFSQNDLGSKDGENLSDGCLIDNNPNTFWHSVWSQGNKAPHSHYLDVVLPEAIDGDLVLTFTRRNADNDQVTRFDVESSMDGVNYSHAAYIDMPNSGKGKTETKEFALEQKAQYLRFWADATTNNRGYWHCSEFQLNQKFTDVELLVDAPDYAYPAAVKALQDAIAATPATDGTKEDVDALAAAVEAYKAALAGYPEFTEWTGEFDINAGEVNNIDDLLNVDLCFNRAGSLERGLSVLGAIFDQTGDAYALVLDGWCGDVEYKKVKSDEFVGRVASVEFKKISAFAGDLQAQAKAAAAKIGAFAPQAGEAYVLIASKSFVLDGEKYNEFKKFTFNLASGTITGVENITVPASNVTFDLQGRRTNATTGLRILNGRVVR